MLRASELPEHELNPRLRRADWRFLLSTPRPNRALCRAGQALTDAVAGIAHELVSKSSGCDCDLVVAEDPDAQVLLELHGALRPGGACYTEWHHHHGGVGRVQRALRAAGFADVTCYRTWPSSAALPVYWIPIGASGAATYVRSRQRLRGGRVRRLLAGARQRMADLLRGRYGGSIYAIAHRPAADALNRDRDQVAWLRAHWQQFELGARPDRLSALLVTGGPRSVSKVVLLAFAEPSPLPAVAVKAPRVEAAAAGLRREGAVLAGLASLRGHPTAGTPGLLFSREIDGVPLIGETALSGRPLDRLLSRRSFGALSIKVTSWLAELARGSPSLPAAHWREKIVEPTLGQFGERFGGVVDPGLVRETEGILRTLGPLPAVPEQRDFGPWNLLVTPGSELAVLDWESGVVEGLPALDLLYYLAYASFNVDRAHDPESRLASYRRSLDPTTRTGAVRRSCIEHYFALTGVEPANLGPLRVLLWLIHAQSDFRHAEADAGGPPPSKVLARGFFLALWAEEVRHVSRRREAPSGR
jgi:hypothetical protein